MPFTARVAWSFDPRLPRWRAFVRLIFARLITANLIVGLVVGQVVGLTGCGWQLQGTARLPALAVQIDTQDVYSEFYRELRAQLLAADAQVITEVAAGGQSEVAVLHIKADETGQRLASVSARNRPQQYEVYYAVDYSIDLRGAEAVSAQRMELTASYSYDAIAVLAKQREQRSMQQALARELAGQLLRRLALLTAQPADTATASAIDSNASR